jgi:hypothetical protein
MKNFFIAFVQFFKTSPLSRWGIFWSLCGLGLLGFFFVLGGIHVFRAENDFSALIFVLVGSIIVGGGIYMINPKACNRFWAETLPPDDSRLDG